MRRRRLVIYLLLPVLAYAGICVLLALLQDRLVFPAAGGGDRGMPVTSPDAAVSWIGAEGQRTRIVTLAQTKPDSVVLYFVGNGEDLTSAARGAEVLAQYGGEVIGVEYPGYGDSAGSPSVASLLATARAAGDVARARAAALGVPLVVVGSSLGSFCATHVAAEGGVAKLVLRAPPTTLAAAAAAQFWWLPVRLLLRQRFDNLAVAKSVTCPTLVVHGDADRIVPLALGRELTAALPHAELVVVPGYGHNDLGLSRDGPAGRQLLAFLGGS